MTWRQLLCVSDFEGSRNTAVSTLKQEMTTSVHQRFLYLAQVLELERAAILAEFMLYPLGHQNQIFPSSTETSPSTISSLSQASLQFETGNMVGFLVRVLHINAQPTLSLKMPIQQPVRRVFDFEFVSTVCNNNKHSLAQICSMLKACSSIEDILVGTLKAQYIIYELVNKCSFWS